MASGPERSIFSGSTHFVYTRDSAVHTFASILPVLFLLILILSVKPLTTLHVLFSGHINPHPKVMIHLSKLMHSDALSTVTNPIESGRMGQQSMVSMLTNRASPPKNQD